ncbi:MAG: class I SAM-dependent methyltransferase [Chloroflexi bacterium]|nr:class I SAM-dependent methyltransferase [Chloroflexota bacterium]
MDDIYYKEREATRYDLEYRWKTDDIPFWQGLTQEYAGREGVALELACGTLRVTYPVAESGVRVHGLDHSPWMLTEAQKRLAKAPASIRERVTLHQGDMRAFDLVQQFDIVYLPFNTLLIMRTTEDQLALFDSVRRHLKPGGVFAFDLFVPDLTRIANQARPAVWANEQDEALSEGGVRVQRDSLTRYDTLRQRILVKFRHREYVNGVFQHEFISDLQLTYIFPRELEHLIARAGFEIVDYWGDYNRTDFWSMQEPWKQILVVRPKEQLQ